ncbi:MAG: cation diffusion facilitator family transporter [Lachnospiraceae bacterium]|nr:cation diffusion facilitator family transporter [Lachnospiraceae bacterium]
MDNTEIKKVDNRNSKIIRTSVIGIAANIFLASFKALVGFLSKSVAIQMDALNNLSDAASSIITIVGTFLAGKEPDKAHPFGHGRAEYLSALLISMLVIYAGATALIESIKKIIYPVTPEYSYITFIVVSTAVVVKIVLGRYVKSVGIALNSNSLKNSGEDALMDAFISASTLAAALIYVFAHVSLEAWLGAIIAVLIIKAGIDMMKETLSKILGESVDSTLARDIKATATSFPEVSGAYDLVLHNYGPDMFTGSLHVEVADTLTAFQLDKLIRDITTKVMNEHGVYLTGIGVYSLNTTNPDAIKMRETVSSIVLSKQYVRQIHGFYYDDVEKNIRFDVVISFDAPDHHKVFDEVCSAVKEAYPEYSIMASIDRDFSEK